MAERIIILHQEVKRGDRQDEQDTLTQARFVAEILRRQDCHASLLPINLDLEKAGRKIKSRKPDRAFNLVESLGGKGEFIHFAAGLLEGLGVPFTGCSAQALFLTSHKLLAKEFMRRAGLPTPDWFTGEELAAGKQSAFFPCIRKNAWEHASLGIDDAAVVTEAAGLKADGAPGRIYWERFVEGREFNIALIEENGSPRALTPAEIRFVDYPPHKPKIVGFKAKWETDSFEYRNTPHHWDFPAADRPLLEELTDIAFRCWELFALSGYARVDFRVDDRNRPWVLEINANPCLAPDAGFYKAALQSGYSGESLMSTILAGAGKKNRRKTNDE